MGRQAYITRLALGRSPFEDLRVHPTAEEILSAELEATAATESGAYVPSSVGYVQRYDRRGHPQNLASEYLREQSRRAQNRLSSILNVYRDNTGRLRENSNDQLRNDPAEIQAVRSENEIGGLILAGDQDLSLLTYICLVGVRQRLQTFHLYAGASLWEVLEFEWIHFGLKKMLFAGFLTSFLNRTGLSLSHRVSGCCDFLAQLVSEFLGFQKHGENATGLSTASKRIFREIIFVFLSPLEIHAIRQRLDLVAMRPFLPPLLAFIPFTYQFPLNLRLSAPLSFDSCAQVIKSLVLSPVVLWYILSYCKRHAYSIMGYYIYFVFPRPDNPDIYSIQGAKMDGFTPEDIPGLDMASDGQSSLIGEAKRDFLAFVRTYQYCFDQWTNGWQTRELRVRSGSLTGSVDEPAQLVATSHMNTVTESVRGGTPPSSSEELIRSVPKNTTTSRPRHRVTFLSASLAALLSRHIAWNLTDLLFIPLESYLLRSIAHGFLSSPQAPSSASGIQSSRQILPLGSWFGVGLRAGGWRGVVSYAGKIGLWWGIEVAAGYLIWQLHAGIVWWYAPWARSRDTIGHDRDGGCEDV